MTSPPGGGTPIVPENGYTAQTIYELQNVDPDALGAASNLDLWEMLENFRNKLLTDLLGGFASVPIAVLDGIEDVIAAITGVLNGDFDDLGTWITQLKTLLGGGTVASPLPSLLGVIEIGQSQVAGLATKLTELDDNDTGLDDALGNLATNINNAVSGGVAAGTGAIEQAWTTISTIFGIAMTAQNQLQDMTNDTEAPAELNGMSWSTVFAGSDGAALPSGDWPTVSGLAIRGASGHAGIASGSGENHHWAVTDQEFNTDGQSASIVLGPRGSNGSSFFTGVYVSCNSGFTAGVYAHVRDNAINLGRFTRSGATFTWTGWTTVSGGVKQGDLVRLRRHGHNYMVVVNGITKLSYTDSGASAPSGASYRLAGISEQRGDYFFGLLDDSYRIASFAMSDWLPAGVNVTTPAWRLRRGSGSEVALSVGHGAQAAMPSGFYTVNDLSEQVTVTDLGTGQVTVSEDGWYEIAASSINRDNIAGGTTNSSSEGSGWPQSQGHLANAYRSSMWVLYVDGTAIAGPIMSGVPVTVYLAAGQVVRPGVSASDPLTPTSLSATDVANYLSRPIQARSLISHVSGSPSASFTGRKVG